MACAAWLVCASACGGSTSQGPTTPGDATAWQRIAPPEHDFAVDLPGTPGVASVPGETGEGETTVYTLTLADGNISYNVRCTPFPDVDPETRRTALEQASAAVAAIENAAVLSRRDLEISGVPAKEVAVRLFVQGTVVFVTARFAIHGNVLYQFIASVAESHAEVVRADFDRFLQSATLGSHGGA
jgi:hypothetical protein